MMGEGGAPPAVLHSGGASAARERKHWRRQGGVVPFQEVWGRSYCRALERLVDVATEYPGEVEHIFSPACVSLPRCTGCCGDEDLHCVPVETANVTMQILKIPIVGRGSYVELTFSQHVRCECRPLREKMKPERCSTTPGR